MARLVDVDELIEYFDGDLEGYDNREYILHMLDSKGRSARVEAIPIKWLCDYAVIIAENNYEQARFIFRLIENYKCELNEDKDKAAIDSLKRMKENWGKEHEID